MNKQECKKYIKKSYKSLIAKNRNITPENIEDEMKNMINIQAEEYIAYAKIAVDNMQNSANEVITLKDLLEEIDVLPRIYTSFSAIERAKNL